MTPAERFRLYCLPRPFVKTKLFGVDATVCALPALEERIITDMCRGLSHSRAIVQHRSAVISASVLVDGARLFSGEGDLARLTPERLGCVWDVVAAARARLYPERLGDELKAGAREASNLGLAHAFGSCVDWALGHSQYRMWPRPDRFLGIHLAALTVGHWEAFYAARAVVADLEKQ